MPPRPELIYPELRWEPLDRSHRHHQALLGNEADGVRFHLYQSVLASRRGSYRLMIEVIPGEHCPAWGTFAPADQPLRWYHHLESAKAEAQAIALAFWKDRCLVAPAPALAEHPPAPYDRSGCPGKTSLFMWVAGARDTGFTAGLEGIESHLEKCPACRFDVEIVKHDFACAGVNLDPLNPTNPTDPPALPGEEPSRAQGLEQIDNLPWTKGEGRTLDLVVQHPTGAMVHAWLTLRPHYCDRGHIQLNIDGPLHLDDSDSFPRFFFSFAEADAHTRAFLKWRMWKERTHPHRLEVPV